METFNADRTKMLTTRHEGNGKYITTLRRIRMDHGVIETSLLRDLLGMFTDHLGTRLSKKNLQAVHNRYTHLLTD